MVAHVAQQFADVVGIAVWGAVGFQQGFQAVFQGILGLLADNQVVGVALGQQREAVQVGVGVSESFVVGGPVVFVLSLLILVLGRAVLGSDLVA